jgi:putative redox protein
MKISATWKDELNFTGTGDAGSTVDLRPAKVGGQGFSPMELLAMGLAGCTAMDVISLLKKKRQDVQSFEVIVTGEQIDEHPRVYEELAVEYVVTGRDIDQGAVDRSIELSASKYCPAAAMLGKTATIKHTSRVVQVD